MRQNFVLIISLLGSLLVACEQLTPPDSAPITAPSSFTKATRLLSVEEGVERGNLLRNGFDYLPERKEFLKKQYGDTVLLYTFDPVDTLVNSNPISRRIVFPITLDGAELADFFTASGGILVRVEEDMGFYYFQAKDTATGKAFHGNLMGEKGREKMTLVYDYNRPTEY